MICFDVTQVGMSGSPPSWYTRQKWIYFDWAVSIEDNQAPVVQRADNFIQWISHYLAVQIYSKQRFWQVFHTIPYISKTYASTLYTTADTTDYRVIGEFLPHSDLSSG